MKNRKGFTLVELLAVIVVLAVIMIFAVPAVLNAMNNARQGAFIQYANRFLSQAEAQYGGDHLLNNWTPTTIGAFTGETARGNVRVVSTATIPNVVRLVCYNLRGVGLTSPGAYHGYVVVRENRDGTRDFFVTLGDGNRSITDRTTAQLNATGGFTGWDNNVQTGTPLNCPAMTAAFNTSLPRAPR